MITYSCSKEDVLTNKIDNSQIDQRSSTKNLPQYTVLGSQRNNPFSLTNINIANAQLYGTNAVPKSKTHTYIRWEPQNYDELAVLEDWETDNLVAFFDTPLDYEIIHQGEKYIDPAVSDSILTYQYSAVPLGTPKPNISHTELEDLYLDKSDLLLLIQSFYITDNTSDINQDLLHGGLTQTQMNALNSNTGPNFPPYWFLFPPEDGCDGDGYAWVLVELVNPDPGISPWSWNCVYVGIPPTYDNPNACGCQIPINWFRPAGCVQVEENGNPEGVEIVQVNVRDTWYSSEVVYSDNNGCWTTEEEYSGEVGIKFKFKNANVKVRDTGVALGTVVIVDQTLGFESQPYHDHFMLYDNDIIDVGSQAREYWASAHSLNFVNQYRAEAATDNIPLPREDLNWLNNSGDNGGGAAPMLQWNTGPLGMEFLVFLVGAPITILTAGLRPDIWNNYGNGTAINPATGVTTITPLMFNAIRSVAKHELGHASHYELVGESFWNPFRKHVVYNSGDGEFGDFAINSSPEIVALGEGVAEYIQERYGFFGGGGEVEDFEDNNFVPQGLLFDLEDIPSDIIIDPNDPTVFTWDDVEGFTPQMFFNALNEDVISVRDFRDELGALHLNDTPNTLIDFNTLIDVYDVFN